MKKLSIVLLLLALVLTIVPSALAQDTFGASQEEFDALTAATEATFDADSMSFDFTISLAVTGMSDEGGDVSADLTGTGFIINDPENPGVMLDVTGTAVNGDTTTPVTLGLRVVDGNVYVTQDGEKWEYSSLADVSSMLGQELSASGLPIDPSALSGDMSSMSGMSGMMAGLEGLQPSDFVTLTVAGNTYTWSVSISDLLASPALGPMIAGAMGGASSGTEMTDAQMKQMVAMIGAMFSEAVVELIQTVESGMVTVTSLNINIPLDIIAPGAGVVLNFTLNLSGFGDTFTVVAPEGAEPMASMSASS